MLSPTGILKMPNSKRGARNSVNILRYEEKLSEWLNKQIEKTGRFDQKPISAERPLPQGYTATEGLFIAAGMISAVRDNPNRAFEIMPEAPDADKPWGMGRQWCEYENACLVNEMSILARGGGYYGKSKCSMFQHISTQLNTKYGIDRSPHSIKNQWYRELRARSGIDERNDFGTSSRSDRRYSTNLRTSIQRNPNKSKGPKKSRRV